MPWLWQLLALLAETSVKLIKGHAEGKDAAELAAIAAESAYMQATLLAQREASLKEAEKLVPGFKVGPKP